MQFRDLGSTGLRISRIALGAGPVAGLMTGADAARQRDVVAAAIALGVNWIDTAPGYGQGQSEESLGRALAALRPAGEVHLATKVRLQPDELHDPARAVRASVEASLRRLRVGQVTLVQLHNAVTARRGDEPDSIAPSEILACGGVLDALTGLRDAGLARFVGLTGIGDVSALAEVIGSGAFQTIQTPCNVLSAAEADYRPVIDAAARQRMGVLAIRVLAGGALAGQPPSEHTRRTRYFPLALFERDARRAAVLRRILPQGCDLPEAAIRFVLSHPRVDAAIVGVADVAQLQAAVRAANAGPLPTDLLAALEGAAREVRESDDVETPSTPHPAGHREDRR